MAAAKEGDTVKVHYTGRLEDGSVFDTSAERDPIEFRIGDGQIIPGFENAIVGMSPGESKTTEVAAADAYGPHRDEAVVVADRDQLPEDLVPRIGQQLQVRQGEGEPMVVTVTEVSETSITLDANHPLAGKDLTFDIELVAIV